MRTHILYSRNLNFLCETVPPNLMRFQPFYRKSNASLIFPSHMVYLVRRWEEEEEERRRRIKVRRSRSSLYRDDLPTIKVRRSRSSLYRDDLPTIKWTPSRKALDLLPRG